MFNQVGIAVVARTNDVFIFRTVTRGQTARTSHVTIAFFIYKQALYQFLGEFNFRIEVIAKFFCRLMQFLV